MKKIKKLLRTWLIEPDRKRKFSDKLITEPTGRVTSNKGVIAPKRF